MNKVPSIPAFARHASLLAVCAASLVACGGGGGGGGDAAPARVDPSAILQNFWSGPVTNGADGATRASAVVMPSGTAWVAMESMDPATQAVTIVGMAKVALSGTAVDAQSASLTGSGNYYTLTLVPPDSAAQALTAAGTVTASSLTGTATTAAGTSDLSWTPVTTPSFTAPAQAADVQGNWRGTLGRGAVQVDWIISAAGGVTGNNNAGCTYTGTVKPSAGGIAVYDVDVTEICAGPPATNRTLAGIATLTSAKTSLRAMYTANSDASGGLLAFNKLP